MASISFNQLINFLLKERLDWASGFLDRYDIFRIIGLSSSFDNYSRQLGPEELSQGYLGPGRFDSRQFMSRFTLDTASLASGKPSFLFISFLVI